MKRCKFGAISNKIGYKVENTDPIFIHVIGITKKHCTVTLRLGTTCRQHCPILHLESIDVDDPVEWTSVREKRKEMSQSELLDR